MSRIGKKPIEVPKGVEVKIEKRKVLIKGPKGEVSQEIQPEIEVSFKEDKIFLAPKVKVKKTSAFWGTSRALLANMVKGVTDGFEKKLEIKGIGFKAAPEGEGLVLNVGFSHPVKVKKIDGIKFNVEKNIITVSGISKQLVGETAAKIKKIKPPDAYKDKGIRYFGEVIKKKVGKKAAASTGA